MPSLNKVCIIGYLGSDPQMRDLGDGLSITTFHVAVNRPFTGEGGERKTETEWFNIVAWRRMAEHCYNHLHKSSLVFIEGHLKTRHWEGQDGQTHYQTEVVADNVQFLDPKAQDGDEG